MDWPSRVKGDKVKGLQTLTHEGFVHEVRRLVLATRELEPDTAAAIEHCKLVYGTGAGGGYRGCCFHEAWENGIGRVAVVEIASVAEESWVQLAGTTIHELAHVAAGHGHGHDADWKAWCDRLGLRRALAAGTVYRLAALEPSIRSAIAAAAELVRDGSPSWYGGVRGGAAAAVPTVRPCSAGVGTRGGKSRGAGSGSRLRLWECECDPKPVKVRVASDDFLATCGRCGAEFHRA